MVEHARSSPWQFIKADFQMGHLLELALVSSPATDKVFCESDYFEHRTRIEGSFEGHTYPEHHASTPKLQEDIGICITQAKINWWDPASRAPNIKRLSPCLHDPSFCYCGMGKPHVQLGGFLMPWKKDERK